MSDEIFEEFNVKCVSYFLKPIIDKESLPYGGMELNGRKPLLERMKLVSIA
ncbi:MAG: hypothetical protein ACTS73_08740 [Arsenophonus sp. NEOnobi-MAG3]